MAAMSPLSPISPNTLADELVIRLRRAIISGQLQPGERLAEADIAATMGVSRGPVREAILQLESEGLVYSRTNRGTYVWIPTERDVDEILNLRAVLETLAASWAIHNLSDADFTHMQDLLNELEQTPSIDGLRLVDHDREFHEFICRKAQYDRVVEAWQRIRGQWEVLVYRQVSSHPDEVKRSMMQDHAALLSALRSRDLDQVAAVNYSAAQRAGTRLKRMLRQSRTNPTLTDVC